jgi:hypothetical protein
MFASHLGLLAVVVACVTGCGGAAPAAPPPITPEAAAQIETAGKLGRAIFEQDEASARADDVLVAKVGHRDPRVGGWITRTSAGVWTTSFVTTGEAEAHVLYETRLAGSAPPTFTAIDPPGPLDAEGSAMVQARATALHAVNARCGDSYNTVVLPGSTVGQEGWLVYLLASSARPRTVILAGHHRLLVSADGSRVLEHTPLSKSCIVAPSPNKPPGSEGAMFVTTLVSDHPTEAHFFTSLHYALDLFVGVGDRVWHVHGDHLLQP